MPRGAKKNANQHNNRHENGVVAPGRRITRQRSNGQLNGSPDGRAGESTPPVPNATASSQSASQSYTNGTAVAGPRASGSKSERSKSLTIDVGEGSSTVDGGQASVERTGEQHHRRIDIGAARPSVMNDGGMVPLALTVLASCPLRDTLAILIFLLSLPPTIVTITNALFAALTFVPPSGSFTLVPTISDITSSFSPGTPSFIVTALIDIIAMSMWLWFPKDAQALALDAAQAMVATTLGGGYNYKPGGSDNTLLCLLIVLSTHLARYRPFLLKQLHRTYLGRWTPILPDMDPTYVDKRYPVGDRNWVGTIKVLIALHITCQGITRSIRRLLQSPRNSTPPSTASNKSSDPEASVGYQTGSELPENLSNPPHSPMELKSRSSLQNMRDVRDKVSSGKRRRKQANYVRSQQPFWAAFAATKATIVREYALSRANVDANNSKAVDTENFGNAPFATSEDKIWVTAVNETTFYFETSFIADNQSYDADSHDFENESGIDRSKPLYVRCNGMNWSSSKLQRISNTEDDYKRSQWVGEVHMLSPGKTYQVSFVRCENDDVLHSETVATLSAPVTDNTATPTTASFKHPRPSSPDSPTATLKHSIAALENNLAQIATQHSAQKKESKATLNAFRREIDSLNDKMAHVLKLDKNLKQRQMQQNQQMRQAEDAIAIILQDLESYTDIPEEETTAWKKRKASMSKARSEASRAQEDHLRTKESNHQSYTEKRTEEISARHKRERLQTRFAKLEKQHKRLNSPEEDEDATTQERSNSDPSVKLPHVMAEHNYQTQITNLLTQAQVLHSTIDTYRSQMEALEYSMEQQARYIKMKEQETLAESRPITPEGDLPGTNPPPSVKRIASLGTPDSHYVPMANGRSTSGNGILRADSARDRSASMMSGETIGAYYTGFDDDDDILPDKVKRRSGFDNIKDGSEGNGSSSGSTDSPHLRYRGKSSPSPRIS